MTAWSAEIAIGLPRVGVRPKLQRYAWVGLLVVLALIPVAVGFSTYYVWLLTVGCLFTSLALAWTILARCGQISLGHAAFFGLGAYTSAIFAQRLGGSPLAGMLLAAIVAASVATLLGAVAFRTRGLYFALATFAANEVIKAVVLNWDRVTGGAWGMVGIPDFPRLVVGGLTIDFQASRTPSYYLVLAFLAFSLLLSHALLNSRVGLAFAAIREGEDVAASLGVDPYRFKLLALLLSAALSGIAGAIYAHLVHFIEANTVFNISLSGLPLIMSLFGGLSRISGPAIGALALYLTDQLVFQPLFPSSHQMFYGAVLVIVLLLMPRGLVGWFARTRTKRS